MTRPERDASEQFNLSILIIIWIEFLCICMVVVALLSFIILYFTSYFLPGSKVRLLSPHAIGRWTQVGAGFSTFIFIRIFNPTNIISAVKQVPIFAARQQIHLSSIGLDDKERDIPSFIGHIFLWLSMLFDLDLWIGKIFVIIGAVIYFACCFIMASLSFAVKTGALSFVGHKTAINWTLSEWISFFGFFYQISNISNNKPVRWKAMLNFIFWTEDAAYTFKETKREKIFKDWVGLYLLVKFGFIKGFMYLRMTLDDVDIYKLSLEKIKYDLDSKSATTVQKRNP